MVDCGLVHAVNDAFQISLNDMERSAKIMGYIGREVPPLLFRAVQFPDHLVEAFDDPLELR